METNKPRSRERYIYDAIYGKIYFPDYLWEVVVVPEIQRLREVRLCNINSLDLTGGANINRYEHAIGTAHLALKCMDNWPFYVPIDKKEKRLVVLAALMHDVISGAFGHSLQYIEAKEGFQHEKSLDSVLLNSGTNEYPYKVAGVEQVFLGAPFQLVNKLTHEEIERLSRIIGGSDRLSPLISGTMDLDNLDNVYRLAYHVGLINNAKAALELASTMYLKEGTLCIPKEQHWCVSEWFETRSKLYKLLLLNPIEFSAKLMLSEAIEIAKAESPGIVKWKYVDFELLEKLRSASSESSLIIKRLMTGDLYGCLSIYSSTFVEKSKVFENKENRTSIEHKLSEGIRIYISKKTGFSRFKSIQIGIHSILDVNKTERAIKFLDEDGVEMSVGRNSRKFYIGVFIKNSDFSVQSLLKVPEKLLKLIEAYVKKELINIIEDENLVEIQQYAEVD